MSDAEDYIGERVKETKKLLREQRVSGSDVPDILSKIHAIDVNGPHEQTLLIWMSNPKTVPVLSMRQQDLYYAPTAEKQAGVELFLEDGMFATVTEERCVEKTAFDMFLPAANIDHIFVVMQGEGIPAHEWLVALRYVKISRSRVMRGGPSENQSIAKLWEYTRVLERVDSGSRSCVTLDRAISLMRMEVVYQAKKDEDALAALLRMNTDTLVAAREHRLFSRCFDTATLLRYRQLLAGLRVHMNVDDPNRALCKLSIRGQKTSKRQRSGVDDIYGLDELERRKVFRPSIMDFGGSIPVHTHTHTHTWCTHTQFRSI
eukprot:GHVR01048987.1.p1 GENE.GHVR01048987.1~~GHVR01048987.1.p1  ORF type:complete len:348 (-),score=97.36 GHVR01048987.1:30-980(-)